MFLWSSVHGAHTDAVVLWGPLRWLCRSLLCSPHAFPASCVCSPTRCELSPGIPRCVLEVTACPFSWSLCKFPLCCEDESHRCHHVVLQRKGRAELLMVTGTTALGAAARLCLDR